MTKLFTLKISIPTSRAAGSEVGTPTVSVGADNRLQKANGTEKGPARKCNCASVIDARSARCNSTSGFVALISAIIIAVILLIFVVGVGAGGFYTRFDILGSEIKERSYSLAESCIQTGILKVSQDDTYTGDEVIPVGDEECMICRDTNKKTIVAQAVYENSYTSLEADIDPDFNITDMRELPEFADTCISS